jgi:hypothetical protein
MKPIKTILTGTIPVKNDLLVVSVPFLEFPAGKVGSLSPKGCVGVLADLNYVTPSLSINQSRLSPTLFTKCLGERLPTYLI